MTRLTRVLAAILVLPAGSGGFPRPAVVSVLAADLGPLLRSGAVGPGDPVRVVCPLRPRPTADPLVWVYSPSARGTRPPAVRFRFAAPPDWPARGPWAVTGVLAGAGPPPELRAAGSSPGVPPGPPGVRP